ncbi:10058_t:CDS:2, partial [Acaulospora colombiana]
AQTTTTTPTLKTLTAGSKVHIPPLNLPLIKAFLVHFDAVADLMNGFTMNFLLGTVSRTILEMRDAINREAEENGSADIEQNPEGQELDMAALEESQAALADHVALGDLRNKNERKKEAGGGKTLGYNDLKEEENKVMKSSGPRS